MYLRCRALQRCGDFLGATHNESSNSYHILTLYQKEGTFASGSNGSSAAIDAATTAQCPSDTASAAATAADSVVIFNATSVEG